jgi:asparagine synthase (glutamine-hydrolysing)
MCGIAGIIYENDPSEAAMASVRRMIALQRHRGPDGEGFYDTVGASLGHCRLAIVDLSDAGRQPMSDPEGRYWITFNGEIYNYIELARELRTLGYRFQGRSDTEVLLAAYRHWGEACVLRLRGMFAFAIWDEHDRCLFAARDRLGIKPFHYWFDSARRLAFASELKALLEFLPERRPNLRLAREYLAWNLLDHEADETMLLGIKRLPPAHVMTWSPRKGITLRRYWDLKPNETLKTPSAKRADWVSEFRERFQDSVSLHLRSDVPVGTCLSGGLDSSSIVCLASAELRRQGAWREDWQHTFSACFDDPRLDERPYIKEVADATGCRTHFVFPRGDQLREELDSWLWHQDEPIGGTGVYAQFCVARLAREHGIKVLLDGQGADEQLAGYRKFILVYLRQLVRTRRYVQAIKEAIAFFSSPDILRTSSLMDGGRYLFSLTPVVALLWPGSPTPERPAGLFLRDSLASRMQADVIQFSLPLLLRYEDRNTMAFGVESRVPFVDHLFVEWLATVPADLLLAGGWTKRILREALVGVLPERVRLRKSKLGFSTPEREWIAGPLAGWLKDTLNTPRHLAEVVDIPGLRKLLDRYLAGDRSPTLEHTLFRLAIYESWARQFLQCDVEPNKRGQPQKICLSKTDSTRKTAVT